MFERFGFSLEQGERIPDCEYCLYMDWHFVCVLKFMVFNINPIMEHNSRGTNNIPSARLLKSNKLT